jgi:hypothetical protein
MPVKRRIGKRRLTPEIELQAWRFVFRTGYDWLGDLTALGFERWPNSEREIRAAAPDAWRRLGRTYLERYPKARTGPYGPCWALRTLGEPPCP